MNKPMVFNYQDYVKLQEENKRLREENTNLQIRCRIAESNNDRDCKNCKHQKPDGCSRWDCEYEPRMDDLISRADAIEAIASRDETDGTVKVFTGREVNEILSALPSEDRPTGWIPIKWHEITDEEREREGYPKDWVVHIDCEMPCDEQEILVQTKKGYIRWDVCYEDGEFSLDSGWDWIEDIVAWMPLPEPYREDGE